MKHLCVSGCVVCMLGLFSLLPLPAQAVVAMSASSAMRGDNFVGNSGGASGSWDNSSASAKREERERAAAEARARRQEIHEQILQQSQNSSLKKLIVVSSPAKEEEQKTDVVPVIDTPAIKTPVHDLSASEYNKKYASRFFKTVSGHITIEQKNIPRKISVSQGSTIELRLKGSEDTFWFLSVNEKVIKVEKNKYENGEVVVILSTIGKGASRIIMDYISKKTSEYKVLGTKKFIVLVD